MKTNQTDKATARYCAAISSAHSNLTLEHSTSIREMGCELDKLRAEHAALVAVAEAAKPALEELQDLADNGIERTFAEGSLQDNGKVVVMLDAATLSQLTEALDNLSAVRGESEGGK